VFRQRSLFAVDEVGIDHVFEGVTRRALDATSWVDLCPSWLRGADTVFDELHERITWRTRRVPMYDREVDEPRLHGWWRDDRGVAEPLPVLATMRAVLTERYGVAFDSIGLNLYRDRHDSVAWHRDRHRRTVRQPVIGIVSVGDRRPFRLRPRGGGASVAFELGHGDLFVMGGSCQHDWEHTVPKCTAGVGPRISITFRHGAERPPR